MRRASLLLLGLAACGYQFSVGRSALPEGLGRVYVPVFENRSSEPEAGAIFAEALAESFARSGGAGGPSSPSRVEGEIVSLVSSPAATQRDGRGVGVYRIRAKVRLRLLHEGALLCTREVEEGEDYLPSQTLLGLDASRRQAVRRLAVRMMDRGARALVHSCPRVVALEG
ncbi:MAG TPA: LptE family protein [Fredinandcohnia sp.]|nr:LptE family protein [Fredinandcohnia sp.]